MADGVREADLGRGESDYKRRYAHGARAAALLVAVRRGHPLRPAVAAALWSRRTLASRLSPEQRARLSRLRAAAELRGASCLEVRVDRARGRSSHRRKNHQIRERSSDGQAGCGDVRDAGRRHAGAGRSRRGPRRGLRARRLAGAVLRRGDGAHGHRADPARGRAPAGAPDVRDLRRPLAAHTRRRPDRDRSSTRCRSTSPPVRSTRSTGHNSTLIEGDVAEAVAELKAPDRRRDPGHRQRRPHPDAAGERPRRRVPSGSTRSSWAPASGSSGRGRGPWAWTSPARRRRARASPSRPTGGRARSATARSPSITSEPHRGGARRR